MSGRPQSGQIYAFEMKAGTNLHAVFKVIGVSPGTIAVAVLDGVWTDPPTIEKARERDVLLEHRFTLDGRPATFGLTSEWWDSDELPGQVLLGQAELSTMEAETAHRILHVLVGCSYAPLSHAIQIADAEWRWTNDREALVAEDEERLAALRTQVERQRTRLKGLTLEQLLSETPLADWSPSPPFPPPAFTNAARTKLREACVELERLGARPRKGEVRAVLKALVLWLNEADRAAGEVIETEEREELCAALEEIAFAARQPSLAAEIDDWRSW